jgi:MHS family proline/betaine transporter-like MFS transporter
VFGGAFLMRPIGGMLLGYVGDKYGRKRALVSSIFLMAVPTFVMGCLPSYNQVGNWAIVFLILVRLLQGLSVGGQLMSSVVFTLENQDRSQWGLYGSFVLASANFGTLLGGLAAFVLKASLTQEQLVAWGWRLPFLSGILVSISGFYLRSHGGLGDDIPVLTGGLDSEGKLHDSNRNPLKVAFSKNNIRAVIAASLVPLLWSGGFYVSFVWMAIYMSDLLPQPVPHAFGVNTMALLISVCAFFPLAGILSDRYSRRLIMTIGGISMAVFSPLAIFLVGVGDPWLALSSQSLLGVALSFWGAPMCAWLVESFEPEVRLTSVAIGYNVAQAIAGGSAPSVATWMVGALGPKTPGFFLTLLAALSLVGLRCVAPSPPVMDPVAPSKAKFVKLPRADTCSEQDDSDSDDELL